MTPAEAKIATLTAEISKLQRTIQRQRTDLGNKDLKIERLTRENIERRRILRNALDGQAGWEVDARAELDTRPRR